MVLSSLALIRLDSYSAGDTLAVATGNVAMIVGTLEFTAPVGISVFCWELPVGDWDGALDVAGGSADAAGSVESPGLTVTVSVGTVTTWVTVDWKFVDGDTVSTGSTDG